MNNIKNLIDNKDLKGIKDALLDNPALANEGIPYDDANTSKAHPLHRICDGVFLKKYTDEEALEMAKIFVEYGADINGNNPAEKLDTPLIAAASLQADKVAILYIDNGANIHHAGTHGGTALHWAAWCGRNKVVGKLIQEGATINKVCIDFKATPLFWAVHGLKKGGFDSTNNHLECIKMLIGAGADKTIPNSEGQTVFDLTDNKDLELQKRLT